MSILTSVTTPGVLDPDPDVARWVPIHMAFAVPAGFNVVVTVQIGLDSALWMTAYDELIAGTTGQSAWAPLFADKSVVVTTGSLGTGRTFTMDVLPNGGWQRPDIKLVPYTTLEIAQDPTAGFPDAIILELGDSIIVGTGDDSIGDGAPLWFSVRTAFVPVTFASHQALSPSIPPFTSEIGPEALVAYAPGTTLAFGPEIMLGKTANALTSKFGYIIKAGIGGSLLDTHWNPTGTYPASGAGNLFNTEVARAQAYETSTGRKIRIIYVNLLTNDAGDAGASSRVVANMGALVSALHALWPNASIVWPLIHVSTGQTNTATVRTNQLSYASTAPAYFRLINIDRGGLQDTLHPNTAAVLGLLGPMVAYQGADMQGIPRQAAVTVPALVGQGVPVFANGASPTLTPLPEAGTLDKDTCLAFCLTNSLTPGGGAGTQTISCSAGWTLVTTGQVTTAGFTSTWALYKRKVPDGEVGTNTVPPSVDAAAAAPTFTIAHGGDSLAQVFTVRGPTPGNQDVDASMSANALDVFGTGPFTIPTWTTITDQDLVLYIVGGAGSVGNASTLIAAGVTGLTKVGESLFTFTSGDTVLWAIYAGTRPTHGAVGTGSLSFTQNTLAFASAVAMKP